MIEKYKFTKNYIRQYHDAIPNDLSYEILSQLDLAFYPATTNNGKINEHRNCFIKKLDEKFNDEISKIYLNVFKSYIKEFKFFDGIKMETSGFDHLLYKGEESHEYKEHVDHSQFTKPRLISCSLLLNDDYEGGNFSFFGGEYVVSRLAYSAIVVPSNPCFPHSITPIYQGDRHSIITWVH